MTPQERLLSELRRIYLTWGSYLDRIKEGQKISGIIEPFYKKADKFVKEMDLVISDIHQKLVEYNEKKKKEVSHGRKERKTVRKSQRRVSRRAHR